MSHPLQYFSCTFCTFKSKDKTILKWYFFLAKQFRRLYLLNSASIFMMFLLTFICENFIKLEILIYSRNINIYQCSFLPFISLSLHLTLSRYFDHHQIGRSFYITCVDQEHKYVLTNQVQICKVQTGVESMGVLKLFFEGCAADLSAFSP